MSESLLAALPGIVAAGRRQAEAALARAEGRQRVELQTREIVVPQQSAGLRAIDPMTANRLINGDNLLAMAALLTGDLTGDDQTPSLRGQIDLIAIDPPFDSRADYQTQITLPGATITQRPTMLEQFAYSDAWADGTAAYLAMLVPRLVLMRELLSEQGSIAVHLDWHVGHYVKIILDELFGRERFLNEIVWIKNSLGAKSRAGQFPRNHESIFLYAKTEAYHFARQFREEVMPILTVNGIEQLPPGVAIDAQGRYFWTGPRGDYTDESIARLDAEGRILRTGRGTVRIKYFLERRGNQLIKQAVLNDTWDDVQLVFRSDDPKTGYRTQKPERLIERIIRASCPPGGFVADLFAGSGTVAAVAERLGRRWLAVDLGRPATRIARQRLIDAGAAPFLVQTIADNPRTAARASLGRRVGAAELSRIVVRAFGAIPLPPEMNLAGNLGHLLGGDASTLVVAADARRRISAATLRQALHARDQTPGGFDRVIVLAWSVDSQITGALAQINDPNLDVRLIPPDLLHRLGQKGGNAASLAGTLRFAGLGALQLALITRCRDAGDAIETLEIRLTGYTLSAPDALGLDPPNLAQLQTVLRTDPLALIDSWAIDPTYDGETFRSLWHASRRGAASAPTVARIPRPAPTGPRRVCIRAVDVFGIESETVELVPDRVQPESAGGLGPRVMSGRRR